MDNVHTGGERGVLNTYKQMEYYSSRCFYTADKNEIGAL
jgi:hypothetical protein